MLVYKTGNEGHRLCEADSCDAGIKLLACAHEAIRLSWYSHINFDLDFCASVNNWMLQCQDCQIDVSLTADKSTIYDLATSLTDHSTYVNLEVWVRRGLTKPLADCLVSVRGVSTSSGESFGVSGTTDTDGIARMRFVWGYGAGFVSKGDYKVKASVVHNSQRFESDSVMITLARTGVKMTYDYQYSYSYIWNPVQTKTITVSIMGTGVRGWANNCPSNYQLTRYFQSVYEDQGETATLTVNDHPGACFFFINSALATNDEQVIISLLQNVDVEYDFPYTGHATAISTTATPADTLTESVTTEHFEWWLTTYDAYYTPKWGNYVRMPYDDGFRSVVWDTSGSFPYKNATTHLQIDMSVEK